VSVKSADKSARIVVRVLWQAERGSRRTREDPRAEVGEDVRVGVAVGPVEFKLNATDDATQPLVRHCSRTHCHYITSSTSTRMFLVDFTARRYML